MSLGFAIHHSRIELHRCLAYVKARTDLRKAHQSIARLIVMYRDSSTELAALKVKQERLRWIQSDVYRRESERKTAWVGYVNGDHIKGKV